MLLVVQAMDTAGKGGIMRHVVGAMDPQGVDITAFKKPTREEAAHDFLWRIRPHLPEPGRVAVAVVKATTVIVETPAGQS